VLALDALVQQGHALYLRAVAELDARPGAVPGADSGATAKTFLIQGLRKSPGQAGAEVREARALGPDADAAAGGLPRLGAALAAGEASRERTQKAVARPQNARIRPATWGRCEHPEWSGVGDEELRKVIVRVWL
jgi:hypothetical protein